MEQAPQDSSQDRSYDPAAEVVQLCQELIGIDTSNYGTDDGPGERKAAEHVAALLDEAGIAAEIIEGRPSPPPQRATTFARPGRPSMISASMPTSSSSAATCSAALRSPGPEPSP